MKSALMFSRSKTTPYCLTIHPDEAGGRLDSGVCCSLSANTAGAQQPCSGLTSGRRRGKWANPHLTASGSGRLSSPSGASFWTRESVCTSVRKCDQSLVAVTQLHPAMSGTMTSQQHRLQHGLGHACPGHRLLTQRTGLLGNVCCSRLADLLY